MGKRGFALILVLALAAALGSFGIAYADPPDGKGKPPWAQGSGGPPNPGPQQDPPSQRHGLFGEIKAVNVGDNTFTLRTKGEDVTVNYASAKCKLPKPLGGSPGKPENCLTNDSEETALFKVGDFVTVSGTWAGTTFNAKRINWVPGRSLHGHCAGDVVGEPTAASLTVACTTKNGPTVNRTFVATGAKLRPEGTTLVGSDPGDIGPDDKVTVVYTRDRATNTYTAKTIVLHQEE